MIDVGHGLGLWLAELCTLNVPTAQWFAHGSHAPGGTNERKINAALAGHSNGGRYHGVNTAIRDRNQMPPMLFTALIGLIFNLFFAGVVPEQSQAGAFKLKAAISIDVAHR
ncbi:hypothetical protein ABIB57_002181 [Devosia sp. UYZn731]|uniref:hypothetical protein n=1 Tax=Devosia sp. UYZn731 TaxID=3156345 RepID=UPI0033956948